MNRVATLGRSYFDQATEENIFYVDKTNFIKEWWNSGDVVTLIARPRRFGKTLTLSMVEYFFSVKYADSAFLFENYNIWKEEEFKKLQGTYPVISLSLASIKPTSYDSMMRYVRIKMSQLFGTHAYLLKSDKLSEAKKVQFQQIIEKAGEDEEYMNSVQFLAECMYHHFGKKVIILIDEYDTPMLEAYVEGFWNEAIIFIRCLFHDAFKDNPYLEKGLLTGITRITQESIFSDLNNLAVVTTTSEQYATYFGFTQEEVDAALEEFGLSEQKEEVKLWYDGFQFGSFRDIYNPWSVINFLKYKKFEPYWMNTSSNALVGKLIQEGMLDVKMEFEKLLQGGTIVSEINEAITYGELEGDTIAVWSWLLTTGYLKIVSKQGKNYELSLTNHEVKMAFYQLIRKWFKGAYNDYNNFVRMLLVGNLEEMQEYMSVLTMATFSFFDVGTETTERRKTEQFYHGFTIGLIADLHKTHILTSNRESGFGRYDVCIEPLDKTQDGIIIEFKVFDARREATIEESAKRALEQIEEKCYEVDLKARGITKVRKYGFAFKGKEVWIEEGQRE